MHVNLFTRYWSLIRLCSLQLCIVIVSFLPIAICTIMWYVSGLWPFIANKSSFLLNLYILGPLYVFDPQLWARRSGPPRQSAVYILSIPSMRRSVCVVITAAKILRHCLCNFSEAREPFTVTMCGLFRLYDRSYRPAGARSWFTPLVANKPAAYIADSFRRAQPLKPEWANSSLRAPSNLSDEAASPDAESDILPLRFSR